MIYSLPLKIDEETVNIHESLAFVNETVSEKENTTNIQWKTSASTFC